MNFYVGFDYAKGYYLKFQSEGRILEFRCCVFSNLENDDEKQHSFLLVLYIFIYNHID